MASANLSRYRLSDQGVASTGAPLAVRMPHPRGKVDSTTQFGDMFQEASDEGRLDVFNELPTKYQATLIRFSKELCEAVVEMGADPQDAAHVAMDTLCASAGLIGIEGSRGE